METVKSCQVFMCRGRYGVCTCRLFFIFLRETNWTVLDSINVFVPPSSLLGRVPCWYGTNSNLAALCLIRILKEKIILSHYVFQWSCSFWAKSCKGPSLKSFELMSFHPKQLAYSDIPPNTHMDIELRSSCWFTHMLVTSLVLNPVHRFLP